VFLDEVQLRATDDSTIPEPAVKRPRRHACVLGDDEDGYAGGELTLDLLANPIS
jgi:hypothetical protein